MESSIPSEVTTAPTVAGAPAAQPAAAAPTPESAGNSLPWLMIAACALPAIVPAILIAIYGVNFPVWDQWHPAIAGLFVKLHQHTLTLADLFAQQNEHRLFVPRLIYLGLGVFTHWNQKYQMEFSVLLAGVTSWSMFRLCRATAPGSATAWSRGLAAWFLCNLLIFTPAQVETWMEGMLMQVIFPMAWTATALAVVYCGGCTWRTVTVAIILAVASTFSTGNGMVAWPLVGALLAWSPSLAQFKDRIWKLAAWTLAAALSIGLYFYHFQRSPYPPFQFLTSLRVYINFLGSPFAYGTALEPTNAAMAVGIIQLVLLAAVIAYAWRARSDFTLSRRILVWLTVAAFAMASGVPLALTRTRPDEGQGIMSHYVSSSIYLAVALINLVPIVLDDVCRKRFWRIHERLAARITTALAAVLLLAQFLASVVSLDFFNGMRTRFLMGKAELIFLNCVYEDDARGLIEGSPPDVLLARANALDELGYLQPPMIHDPDISKIAAQEPGQGKLEQFGANQAGQLVAVGWAILPGKHRPADSVLLTSDDYLGHPILFAIAEIGARRDDIASRLKDDAYTNCGWGKAFARTRLPADVSHIRAWAFDTDTAKAYPLEGDISPRQP
jgi:hypothetical protein